MDAEPGVELQAVHQVVNLQVGFEEGLALLGRQQVGDLRRVLFDELDCMSQGDAPVLRRGVGPVGERLLGCVDGLQDILLGSKGGAVHHLAGGWIIDVVSLS